MSDVQVLVFLSFFAALWKMVLFLARPAAHRTAICAFTSFFSKIEPTRNVNLNKKSGRIIKVAHGKVSRPDSQSQPYTRKTGTLPSLPDQPLRSLSVA